ncbi:hypothetical protein M3Y97_00723300 [Aphelenchoides bicaudatus]|nr:hypothetical protein M3Y97_00723300 [Aphelenchoides bicaudatus]
MRTKIAFVCLAIFILLTVCNGAQAARGRQKRLNFNFLRTWQPAFPNAEPLQQAYGDIETNEIEPIAVVRTPEERIKSRIKARLDCINALANPSACNDI